MRRDWESIDEVYYGCVTQAGEDALSPTRDSSIRTVMSTRSAFVRAVFVAAVFGGKIGRENAGEVFLGDAFALIDHAEAQPVRLAGARDAVEVDV